LLEAHVADPDSTPEECWRPVVGWEQFYAVSSLGRVKRTARGRGARAGLILRPIFNPRTGYYTVCLYAGAGYYRRVIHKLVAEAFLGPRPAGLDINHISGDKTDNRASNLEYCTHTENMAHAVRLGLMHSGDRSGARTHPECLRRGETHGCARLRDEDVREIRRLAASGLSAAEMAPLYGMSPAQVARIVRRRSWRHVQ
jgi:hypothetical protein